MNSGLSVLSLWLYAVKGDQYYWHLKWGVTDIIYYQWHWLMCKEQMYQIYIFYYEDKYKRESDTLKCN